MSSSESSENLKNYKKTNENYKNLNMPLSMSKKFVKK